MAVGNTSSSKLHVSGMASGLDSDSIVKSLMNVERVPYDKLKQKEQKSIWTRDAYREMTNMFRGFVSDNMDVLKPSANMLSSTFYKKFTSSVISQTTGAASSLVTVTGNSDASAGNFNIQVKQIASADKAISTATVTNALASGQKITTEDLTAMAGKKISLTVDGVTKEITLGTYADVDSLISGLANENGTGLLDKAFGKGKVNVNPVSFGSDKGISFSSNSSKVTVNASAGGASTDALQYMHIVDGAVNRLNSAQTLGQLAKQFASPLAFDWSDTTSTSFASTDAVDFTNQTWSGKKFSMTIDGVTKDIVFDAEPNAQTASSLADKINSLVDNAFGANKVKVSASSDGKISFTHATGPGAEDIGYISVSSGGVNATTNQDMDALKMMNITNGASASGILEFTINNKTFDFKASQSLSSMMSTINADTTAGVRMTYDGISDTFNIVSKQMGAGQNIVIGDSQKGNFFGDASGIDTGSDVTIKGQDAILIVNPGQGNSQTLTRSTNNISVNGMTFNLQMADPTQILNVSMKMDTDTVFNNIKKFVDQYNTLIDKINTKISEKYDRNYAPLTDDQKNELSEDQVTKWETIAKTGLLHNDSILQKIADDMRQALTQKAGSDSTTLSAIGITTGAYQEKGKLNIDENKLRAAIESSPDSVMNLFSKQSSSVPYYSRTLDNSQKKLRQQEEGLANKLYDILQDNVSTLRDGSGRKGSLLEKAGMVGDASEFTNILTKEIEDDETRASSLLDMLNDKETSYYKKYSDLEVAMSKLNSQSTWLTQQLSAM